MKAEDLRQANTQTEEPARIAGGAGLGAEIDVTTRLRTPAIRRRTAAGWSRA